MRKNSKILSMFLCTILVFAFTCGGLTGCILAPKKPGGNVAADEITISRWASQMEEAQFRAWTDRFTELHPEIKVVWRFLPYEAHFSSLQTALLGGSASDIVCLNSWGWYGYSDADGLFVDLNTVPALAQTIDDLIPRAQESFISPTGKRLGIANGSVTRRPVVNIDDFATADVDIPYDRTTSFTLQEISDLLYPVVWNPSVAMGDGRMKTGINFNGTELMFGLAASAGAPIVNHATKTVDVDTPAGRAAMLELRRFYRENGSGVNNTNNNKIQIPHSESASLENDQALTSTACVAAYTGTYSYEVMADAGFNVATLPSVKATGGTDTLLLEFNNFAIPQASTKKDMVYTFIQWALSEEGQLAFAAFSDLPVNADAYNTVSSEWEPTLYKAMNVGINNVYVMEALPSDFSAVISDNLPKLLEDSGDDEAIVAAFTAAMKAAEQYL